MGLQKEFNDVLFLAIELHRTAANIFGWPAEIAFCSSESCKHFLGFEEPTVVQNLDNAIHLLNLYPVDIRGIALFIV